MARAASPERVAFIGTDDEIYTCAAACAHPECITCPSRGLHVERDAGDSPLRLVQQSAPQPPRPMRYGWPTFSPDGSKLAFAWAGPREDGNFFGISVYDFNDGQTTDVFASRTEKVVYIFWPPGGKRLSFLLEEPHGLSLILAEVREHAPVRIVLSGVPLFFDWSAGADKLLVHTRKPDSSEGESVELIGLTPANQNVERVLAKGRLPFKAPCWSPDGKHLAYIANFGAETYLVVAGPDGKHPRSLASLPVGFGSLVWSPDSRHIAFSTSVIGGQGLFHGIKLLDISSGEIKHLTNDNLLAYFFSPNARYLAYVAAPDDRPYYTWKLVDLRSGKVRTLGNFLATREESISYRYFDQLALSHTIWSRDSKTFVYAGVRLLGEPRGALGRAPEPRLWIVAVNGAKPKSVAPATLGFFSPAHAK